MTHSVAELDGTVYLLEYQSFSQDSQPIALHASSDGGASFTTRFVFQGHHLMVTSGTLHAPAAGKMPATDSVTCNPGPDSTADSAGKTALALSGTGAPVMMRIACPAPRRPANGRPGNDSPTTALYGRHNLDANLLAERVERRRSRRRSFWSADRRCGGRARPSIFRGFSKVTVTTVPPVKSIPYLTPLVASDTRLPPRRRPERAKNFHRKPKKSK